MSLRIDSGFRNLPISPEHKPYLVVQTQPGRFYIDYAFPFGVASAIDFQEQITDAIVDIVASSNTQLTVKAWVDDVIILRGSRGNNNREEQTNEHDVKDIFALSKELGVPWEHGSCFRYEDFVTYSGLIWNLRDRCVSLPDRKREQYVAKLTAFSRQERVSLKESMEILDILTHLTFVYTCGRQKLAHLSTFTMEFPIPQARQFVDHNVSYELAWWLSTLETNSSRTLTPRSTQHDPGVWVFTTALGIAIVIGGKCAAWTPGSNSGWGSVKERKIGWAGIVALELTCLCLEAFGISDATVIVRTNDAGIIDYLRRGSSDLCINVELRLLASLCMASNLELLPQYVDNEYNLAHRKRLASIPQMPLTIVPKVPWYLHMHLTREKSVHAWART